MPENTYSHETKEQNLYEQICSLENLEFVFEKARKGKLSPITAKEIPDELPAEVESMIFVKLSFSCGKYLNLNCLLRSMTTETVSITAERYDILVKKEAIADDLVLQMESSLRDLEAGRVHRVR